MSKIFYDHLIIFEELEGVVGKNAKSSEEKEELWKLVDDIVHTRILSLILDNLEEKHHEEFLDEFHLRPHDRELLSYLKGKSERDIVKLIQDELDKLEKEILKELT